MMNSNNTTNEEPRENNDTYASFLTMFSFTVKLVSLSSEDQTPPPSNVDILLRHRVWSLSSKHSYERKAWGDEAKNYDFKAARPSVKTTDAVESIEHLIKSCLGGGVVAMHEAYIDCGVWSAAVLTLLLGFLVGYCMFILTKAAQKMYGRLHMPHLSYAELADAALSIGPWPSLRRFGKIFRYTVVAVTIADLSSSCCVYQAMSAFAVRQLMGGPAGGALPPLRAYIAVLTLPCLMLCLMPSVKYLAPFSLVADLFIVTIALTTMFYCCKLATDNPIEMPVYRSLHGLSQFVGVCVFSMEGVGITLAIENHMTRPKEFHHVVSVGMLIVTVIILIIGFSGAWVYGNEAVTPITLNYPWDPFPLMLKIFLLLMMYVTYALNFWVSFDVLWQYIKNIHSPSRYWIWARVYRAIMIFIIITVAIIFPSVTKFIAMISSVCLSQMGFIYPAIIELSVVWEDPGLGVCYWRLIKFTAIFSFGLTFLILGTYLNISELFT